MYKYILLCLLLPSLSIALEAPKLSQVASKSPPSYIVSLVKEKSEKYGIPFIIPLVIIQEESRFNPKAINKNDGGEGCNSKGLVQINSCYHKYTDEQVYDVEFSIEFLISNLAKNKCKMWATCPVSTPIIPNTS